APRLRAEAAARPASARPGCRPARPSRTGPEGCPGPAPADPARFAARTQGHSATERLQRCANQGQSGAVSSLVFLLRLLELDVDLSLFVRVDAEVARLFPPARTIHDRAVHAFEQADGRVRKLQLLAF